MNKVKEKIFVILSFCAAKLKLEFGIIGFQKIFENENNKYFDFVTLVKTGMMQAKKQRIFFEPRMELRTDLAIVETFQDGSQLIRKYGLMIIVDASIACLSQLKIKANLTLFSSN